MQLFECRPYLISDWKLDVWTNNRAELRKNCENISYLITLIQEKSRVDVLASLPLINRLAVIINKRIL